MSKLPNVQDSISKLANDQVGKCSGWQMSKLKNNWVDKCPCWQKSRLSNFQVAIVLIGKCPRLRLSKLTYEQVGNVQVGKGPYCYTSKLENNQVVKCQSLQMSVGKCPCLCWQMSQLKTIIDDNIMANKMRALCWYTYLWFWY